MGMEQLERLVRRMVRRLVSALLRGMVRPAPPLGIRLLSQIQQQEYGLEPSENRNGRHGILRRAGIFGAELPPGRNHLIDLSTRNDHRLVAERRLVLPPGRNHLGQQFDGQHRFRNVFGQFVLPARRNHVGNDYHRKSAG